MTPLSALVAERSESSSLRTLESTAEECYNSLHIGLACWSKTYISLLTLEWFNSLRALWSSSIFWFGSFVSPINSVGSAYLVSSGRLVGRKQSGINRLEA